MSGTPKAYRELCKRLKSLNGCGPRKLDSLKVKFPTEETLLAASPSEIATTKFIGAEKAKEIHQVLHGQLIPQRRWAGKERVEMWNTLTRKKLTGAAAPTVDKADAWLAQRPEYERYNGQDQHQKSQLHVPAHCKMTAAAYECYCEHSNDDGAQLRNNLSKYSLHLVSELAAEIFTSIAHAAEHLGHARGEVQASLGAELGTSVSWMPKEIELADEEHSIADLMSPHGVSCGDNQHVYILEREADEAYTVYKKDLRSGSKEAVRSYALKTRVLETASRLLKRPLWVFTNRDAEDCVYEVAADDAQVDPQRVEPLRLAQCGNSFFAVAASAEEAAGAQAAEAVKVAQPVVEIDDEVVEVIEVQLPEIKEDLSDKLDDVLKLIGDTEMWSQSNFDAPLDLTSFKKTIDDFQERLRSGDGLDGALIGDNGVGKSTLVNTSCMNTMHDESTYAASSKQVPEAVRELLSGQRTEPPTLETLLADRKVHGRDDVSVQLLAPSAASDPFAAANEVKLQYEKLEKSICTYAEVEGQARPKVDNFLLPCGMADQSTTKLHTRVRSGKTFHALVEFSTMEELKQRAYQFVQVRRELGDDNPKCLDKEKQRELLQVWHIYLNITKGMMEELPRALSPVYGFPNVDALEDTWSDIQVCDALKQIVESQYILYLGGGTDLHLDRKHVHDLLLRLNHKENLQRVAAKSVEVFVPASVLEGGSSFVDLPGLNDRDGGCYAETVEGLHRAGLIFVLLKKTLNEDDTTVEFFEDSGLLKRILQIKDVQVVFIINREVAEQGLSVEQIITDEEAENRRKIEGRNRKLWEEELSRANLELREAGEECCDDAEVEKIAQETQIRTIYPMMHTAYKLHTEHAEKDLEKTKKIFETSNCYWLLGTLEALNRDGYVRELERIVTTTLPQLRDKLQSSLSDVQNSGSVALPPRLVTMAETWLKQTRSNSSGFALVLESLKSKVQSLTTGTECFKAQLNNLVHEFMANDASVQHFLEKAATNQPASWADLRQRIEKKGLGPALKAVDPRNKGVFKTLEIMPVAFGSKNNQVQIDFEPLIEDLQAKLEEVKEAVIDDIHESVDEAIANVLQGDDTTNTSVRILKESFVASDVVAQMNQRFRNFFTARQHKVDLKNDRPADYFKKFAVEQRVTALKTKVLSGRPLVNSVDQACMLIQGNLAATRDEWKRIVTSGLEDFVGGQFVLLYWDLTWGAKGLLKGLLRAFLQHIVQTARMQESDELQQQLRRFLRELQQQTNAAHALWTRIIKRVDAEELGRAASQHVERTRHRKMIQLRAKGCALKHPAMRMPPLELQRADMPTGFLVQHTFLSGNLDGVSTLNQQVLAKYKRGVCRSGRPDLFSAFAMVAWGRRGIKEALGEDGKVKFLDALTTAAKQLRAVCASQMRHFFRKKRAPEFVQVLGEPIENYIQRLEQGDEYSGDGLCLWFLAVHFQQNFVLWKPGAKEPTFFSSKPEMPKEAHHLVLTAEPPEGQPGASSYSPVWFFFQDERTVKFKPTDSIRLIEKTDDEDDQCRRSWPRSLDTEMVDTVQKRKNPDGTVTTFIDDVAIVNTSREAQFHSDVPVSKKRAVGSGSSSNTLP